MIKFLRNLFIAEIGPLVITLIFLVFTASFWGAGINLVAEALIMIPVAGLGALLLDLVFRKRTVTIRISITSLFALMIAIVLQLWQFSMSNPDDLKSAILAPELENKFKATKGRVMYGGFETEAYVELQSNPALTREFLTSRAYEERDMKDPYGYPDGPWWFPDGTGPRYRIYEHASFDTEEHRTVFVSMDSSVIYGFYLSY